MGGGGGGLLGDDRDAAKIVMDYEAIYARLMQTTYTQAPIAARQAAAQAAGSLTSTEYNRIARMGEASQRLYQQSLGGIAPEPQPALSQLIQTNRGLGQIYGESEDQIRAYQEGMRLEGAFAQVREVNANRRLGEIGAESEAQIRAYQEGTRLEQAFALQRTVNANRAL